MISLIDNSKNALKLLFKLLAFGTIVEVGKYMVEGLKALVPNAAAQASDNLFNATATITTAFVAASVYTAMNTPDNTSGKDLSSSNDSLVSSCLATARSYLPDFSTWRLPSFNLSAVTTPDNAETLGVSGKPTPTPTPTRLNP